VRDEYELALYQSKFRTSEAISLEISGLCGGNFLPVCPSASPDKKGIFPNRVLAAGLNASLGLNHGHV
jgi:hypothetical protein